MAFFILLITVLLIAYLYIKQKQNYWKTRAVPHEPPRFLLGNLRGSLKELTFFGFLVAEMYKRFNAPYFGFYAFTKPTLVIKDPEIIRLVLVKEFSKFSERMFKGFEEVDAVAFNSLLWVRNPTWKLIRSKMSPAFSSGKMKLMMPLMRECGENLVEYLVEHEGDTLEMKEVLSKYTTDIISSCAFGINANCLAVENSQFRIAGRKIFDPTQNAKGSVYFYAPILAKIFNIKFMDEEAVNFLRNVFWETVDKRESDGIKRNDLIDILMQLRNDNKSGDEYQFVGDRLVAQAVMFFAAGHETSAGAVSYCLYELCLNRSVQEKLRGEIRKVLNKHGDVTYEALQEMKYMDAVFSETLRKYPFTPFLVREAQEDYKLPNHELTIERNTQVMIPILGLHYDPQYFEDPEAFEPDRFTDENKDKIIPYTYMPFGLGPRNCIGERFAWLSGKLALTIIVSNFEILRCEDTPVPIEFSKCSPFVVSKHGIPLKLKRVKGTGTN